MTRLQLQSVAKSFGSLEVLRDISLHVAEGEFVSVLGPSGAGKTTIFNLLTGAEQPQKGSILFDGAPLGKASNAFAFMPQRDALMPWRRMIDNATLGLEVQGMSRKDARKLAEPLFEEFGLAGFEQAYPAELSGGMRQRAALLRTVVQQRKMLLLDEPFGALDALTRASMQHWLESMWQSHRWTALLITHDVREAVYLSDRIYVLSARPSRVVHEVTVDLPRPRRDSMRKTALEKAAALEAGILDLLLNS
ncbi:ABC transporter ATP-binding protein [Pseudochrobactrum asaccharolyticum]|uniref:ABC-type nitrate/sulfonate/bicarbonate transport system ATPase subunit n=1 Tax=Pseudochrobactrum asaccharolyticum TaxID=354351 RepID=A0A366DPU2_9HYPH|nr:ABC transporter ATP-binding protein [Pseudochrobactrum asaccharolyticum]RBO92123.1 ABC-type nitrate/sulfonate/bicarbonate transport system ATPase subunit [Pseudochrobactrum asaccharolyticum]